MICKICNKEVGLKGFSTHLKTHNLSTKEYYDTYLKTDSDGICVVCGKPTAFTGIHGYKKHCSNRCAQLDPLVIQKKANTCIQKFGVDNPYKSENVKQKIRTTTNNRFGVDSVLQLSKVRQRAYDVLNETSLKIRQTKLTNIQNFETENDCTLKTTLIKQFGQGWLKLNLPELTLNGHAHFIENKYITKIIDCVESNGSAFEYDVRNFVRSIYSGKIICNSRSIIPPLELDIYLPELKLAIECNGIFWHSDLTNTPKDYHFRKSIKCKNIGIHLIHIFEDEWPNIKTFIQDVILGKSNQFIWKNDRYIIFDFNKQTFKNVINFTGPVARSIDRGTIWHAGYGILHT